MSDVCQDCGNKGWFLGCVEGTEDDYIPDMVEKYCTCAAATRRKELDGVPDHQSGKDME